MLKRCFEAVSGGLLTFSLLVAFCGCGQKEPEGVVVDPNAPIIKPDPNVKGMTLENEAEFIKKGQAPGRAGR